MARFRGASRYLAELDYGRDTMDKYRRQVRVSETALAYVAKARPTVEPPLSLEGWAPLE